MKDKSLPERWAYKHNAYYYRPNKAERTVLGPKRWIRLGKTLEASYKAFAALTIQNTDRDNIYLVRDLANVYEVEVVPDKAFKTQKSNRASLVKIREAFGHIPYQRLEPKHAYDYYYGKGETRTARAVIEVLRHMFTKAVEWGLLNRHPLKGQVVLKRNPPRRRYVTDDELIAFRAMATPKLQAYIDLKLATGLAKQDILCLDRSDIKDDGLHAYRRKTGARPKVYTWDDEGILKSLLEAVHAAHAGEVGSSRLFHTRNGDPYYHVDDKGHALGDADGWDSMWQRLRQKWIAQGGESFTDHDIRAKAASDTDLNHAQQLMDHASSRTTESIYRRGPKVVSIHRKERQK